jgi:hypothetical protein
MDLITVLRSRITAAAVGVSVLGVTAALVPTVSNAADDTVVAATPHVTWADSAADFTRIDLDAERPVIPAGWSWFGLDATAGQAEDADSLDDVATFGADGISAKPDTAVYLLHGFTDTVTPTELPAVVEGARSAAGESTVVGLLVADASDPKTVVTTAYAEAGLTGDDTTWAYEDDGSESTADLATDLAGDHRVVFGYVVGLAGAQSDTAEPEPTATPTATPTAGPTATPTGAPTATPTAPTSDSLERFLPTEAAAAAPSARVVRAAVAPSDTGIASLRIDDTTSYFTPQPTAAVALAARSLTVTQATTTGFRVTGSGFAPGETVSVGLAQGQSAVELPGTLLADADGKVAGTVVLPAATTAGDRSLVLVGASSGQRAAVGITVTADPSAVAPVATPVTGRATFTG